MRPLALAGLATALACGALAAPASPSPTAAAATTRQITYTQWGTTTELQSGVLSGTTVDSSRLVLESPRLRRTYEGRTYDVGRWRSGWARPGFGLSELVASWAARTPGDSWIEVEVRGRTADGTYSSWDTLARWAEGDAHVRRTTVSGQSDDLASVSVDTWRATQAAGLTSYQLQVSLLRRRHATTASPSVDSVGAVASRLPSGPVTTSTPGLGRRVALAVPSYSQMIHEGHYARYGNGGEAWCSPTSTSMLLGYYRRLPSASSYSWVPRGHVDPWVDHAARATYDNAYRGTGNWPFNTAYAATRTGKAFVTRLRSLREAELFIARGIPLAASISFGRGELTGAPIAATDGHLVVISGFAADGDVLVNDPAAPSDSGVRRTYRRGQFERAWLSRSGGLVYVVTDRDHPLPAGTHTNW